VYVLKNAESSPFSNYNKRILVKYFLLLFTHHYRAAYTKFNFLDFLAANSAMADRSGRAV